MEREGKVGRGREGWEGREDGGERQGGEREGGEGTMAKDLVPNVCDGLTLLL
jgi:hypothetical protein